MLFVLCIFLLKRELSDVWGESYIPNFLKFHPLLLKINHVSVSQAVLPQIYATGDDLYGAS